MLGLSTVNAVALFLLSLAASSQAQEGGGSSLSDVLEQHANLSSFRTLLTDQFPQILRTLEEEYSAEDNPVTILAPSNRAFEGIVYNNALNTIFANNDTLGMSQVISYHCLQGSFPSTALNTSFKFIPSLTSSTNFSNVDGGQRVGAVLQNPPNGSEYDYEVVFVSGESTRSVVTIQDLEFAGGVIQVIDNFLIPPNHLVPTAETFNLANPPNAIGAFLGATYSTPDPALRTLLNDTKDVTIFVPSNVAFETVADALINMDNNTRMELLAYHVMVSDDGPLYSSDFTNNTQITMLTNDTATLSFFPNSFFINSARIVQSDILIYNGVMHIIDVVLEADANDRQPNPTFATQPPVLPTAGTDDFNISQAPFTTYMPNYIPMETPTTASDSNPNGARTSSAYASGTSTGESDAAPKFVSGWTTSLGAWAATMLMTALVFAAL